MAPGVSRKLQLVLTFVLILAWQLQSAVAYMWTTAEFLSLDPRTNLAAASVKDVAMFGGGYGNGGLKATLDIYNATSKVWTQSTLSQARQNLAAAAVADRYILFGGGKANDDVTIYNTVDIYDAELGLWNQTTLSVNRTLHAAASLGNLAFFAGGQNSAGLCDTVDVFNAGNGAWSTSTLSSARYDLAAAAAGDYVLFAGGVDTSGIRTSLVDIYNILTDSWSTTTLSVNRSELVATSVGNLIFFAGGQSQNLYSNQVDIFDSTTGQWLTSATLTIPRENIMAASISEIALFAGGESQVGTTYLVDVYNVTSGQWTSTNLPIPAYSGAAASIQDIALFGGGLNSSGYLDSVSIYNVTATSSSPSPSPLTSTTPIPTPSTLSSPSSLPTPTVTLITSNVTSSFSSAAPVVNLTTLATSSSSTSQGVQVSFGHVQAPGQALNTSGVYQFSNASDGTAVTSANYRSFLTALGGFNDSVLAAFDQSFSFASLARQTFISGLPVLIPAGNVKWTINVNTTIPFPNGLIFTYVLSDLSIPLQPSQSLTPGNITTTTDNNITTYLIPLHATAQSVAKLEVIDLALVDGVWAQISHQLQQNNATFRLILQFPPFNNSLEYDPIVGLGTLLGSSTDSGSGSSNVGLIVGTVVGICGALVLVALVIGVAILLSAIYAKRHRKSRGAISLGTEDQDSML